VQLSDLKKPRQSRIRQVANVDSEGVIKSMQKCGWHLLDVQEGDGNSTLLLFGRTSPAIQNSEHSEYEGWWARVDSEP
jgi:hypothetical protein